MHKRAIVLIMSLILIFSSLAVSAENNLIIDFNKTASLTVTLSDSATKKPIGGGEITIYRIADFSAKSSAYPYKFTKDFEDCKVSLDNIFSADSASLLESYALSNDLKGERAAINTSGIAEFKNLPLGLYLVLQTKTADNYYVILPFMVSLPMMNDDGDTWIYDVSANPKADSTPEPPEEDNLIQTGQLNWPIPLMLSIGTLLIILGCWLVLIKRGRNA